MAERKDGNGNFGRGLEFIARRYNYARDGESCGRVLKKTYYPLFDRTDLAIGKSMKDRAESDLDLIRDYFGSELTSGARVVERFGKWYISQPDYGDKRLTSQSAGLEILKPRLGQIMNQNGLMVAETGFTLDMVGVEFWSELGNYLKDSGYWALDSFRITGGEDYPELRLADTGLLWTRLESPQMPQHINIHELPAGWVAVNLILPTVRQRMGLERV